MKAPLEVKRQGRNSLINTYLPSIHQPTPSGQSKSFIPITAIFNKLNRLLADLFIEVSFTEQCYTRHCIRTLTEPSEFSLFLSHISGLKLLKSYLPHPLLKCFNQLILFGLVFYPVLTGNYKLRYYTTLWTGPWVDNEKRVCFTSCKEQAKTILKSNYLYRTVSLLRPFTCKVCDES